MWKGLYATNSIIIGPIKLFFHLIYQGHPVSAGDSILHPENTALLKVCPWSWLLVSLLIGLWFTSRCLLTTGRLFVVFCCPVSRVDADRHRADIRRRPSDTRSIRLTAHHSHIDSSESAVVEKIYWKIVWCAEQSQRYHGDRLRTLAITAVIASHRL